MNLQQQPMTATLIAHAACVACAVDITEYRSDCRHPAVVVARGISVLIARKHTHLSFPEMAEAFGRPNHSTLLTMRDRWRQRLTLNRGHPHRILPLNGENRDIEDLLLEAERMARQNQPGRGAKHDGFAAELVGTKSHPDPKEREAC